MTHSTLRLSYEVGYLKRSVMRNLLSIATAPDIISLAGGLPSSEHLPVQAYQECLERTIRDFGPRAMQYSPQHTPLREWILNYMRSRGVDCSFEQVFITNGAQQGLAILSRLFLDPDQPAFIEETIFTGIQQVTSGRGAHVHTATTDLKTGVHVEQVEEIFKQLQPRLAIFVPEFHNPLGVTIVRDKREQIAQLASRYNVPIIEDDPYSPLRFEGDSVPPIKAFDESGHVFYLGSFSKMLAPGIRLGWIVAPEALVPKITVIRESLDLETSTMTQRAVADFLEHGYLEPHLEGLRAHNHRGRSAMVSALEKHFGEFEGCQWTKPQGGLFVWVTLPEGIDTWEMFETAVEQKVAYIPGSAFNVYERQKNTMRLNFGNASTDDIECAIQRLAEIIKTRL